MNRLGIPETGGLKHFLSPPAPAMAWHPGFGRDHHGRRYGKLTVAGFHGRTGSGRAVWLVRCDCGDYELRRGASLGGFKHYDDQCFACSHEVHHAATA